MPKRLMFGDDGSTHADAGWLWIQSHSWPDWRIEVVTVLPDEAEALPPRESLGHTGAREVAYVRADGPPASTLLELGATCDLVVVGHKGHGWRKRIPLGSTAEHLMHNPMTPVVIVRGGRRTQRLLLAFDGSIHAREVERVVANLPWLADVEVIIVEVADPDKAVTGAEDAAHRLSGVAKRVETQLVSPDRMQVFYRPQDIIIDQARARHVDLIALGSRGLGRWDTLNELGLRRAGSTAIAVAKQAPCSVLLGEATS